MRNFNRVDTQTDHTDRSSALPSFWGHTLGYTFVLGDIDGLPQLPKEYLVQSEWRRDRSFNVRCPNRQPINDLREAFGPNSFEVNDQIAYKNQFEIRDRGFVISCGQPITNGTPNVVVSPFSMAMFGSRRKTPANAWSRARFKKSATLHADRAVLTYDRPINNPGELAKAESACSLN